MDDSIMEGSSHCDEIEPAKLVDVSGLIKENGKEAEHDVEEGHAEKKHVTTKKICSCPTLKNIKRITMLKK